MPRPPRPSWLYLVVATVSWPLVKGLFRLRATGVGALETMRLEKAFRDMGHDIDSTDTPLEAGLGFAVAWDKDGGFVGREALLKQRESGPPSRRLVNVLLTFSRTGRLPLKVIGSRLMVHPTSVTNAIDRLVAAGYVERRPNPADGRGVLAGITADGREVVEAATRALTALDFGLADLREPELDTLFAVLRRVRLGAGDIAGEGTGDAAGPRP